MASVMVENKDRAIAMFQSGMKQKDIALELNISYKAVSKWFQKWGLTKPRQNKPRVSEEELPEFVIRPTPVRTLYEERLMENAILAKPVDKTPKPYKTHGKWYHDVTEEYMHEYD